MSLRQLFEKEKFLWRKIDRKKFYCPLENRAGQIKSFLKINNSKEIYIAPSSSEIYYHNVSLFVGSVPDKDKKFRYINVGHLLSSKNSQDWQFVSSTILLNVYADFQ